MAIYRFKGRASAFAEERTIEVEMTPGEYNALMRGLDRLSSAELEGAFREAIATNGETFKPREDPGARLIRQFYVRHGRFPTLREKVRAALA